MKNTLCVLKLISYPKKVLIPWSDTGFLVGLSLSNLMGKIEIPSAHFFFLPQQSNNCKYSNALDSKSPTGFHKLRLLVHTQFLVIVASMPI